MDNQSRKEFINAGKDLSPFFEVEISIRVLGIVIWHYVFPPRNKFKK